MRTLLAASLLILASCSTPPSLFRQYDEFTGTSTFGVRNNRMEHSDPELIFGVFAPALYTEEDSSTDLSVWIQLNGFDWTFISEGESMIWLVDGNRFVFSGRGSIDSREVLRGGLVKEMANYPVTKQDLGAFANGKDVRVRIVGDRRERHFVPSQACKDIVRQFVAALP